MISIKALCSTFTHAWCSQEEEDICNAVLRFCNVPDDIGFVQTMYRATFTPEQGWSGGLEPYAPLQLDPSAQVLNYGQSVFEGMKAQRTPGGNIVLFRPDENAARMMAGVRACPVLCACAVQQLVYCICSRKASKHCLQAWA
jgi:hypothetical protein